MLNASCAGNGRADSSPVQPDSMALGCPQQQDPTAAAEATPKNQESPAEPVQAKLVKPAAPKASSGRAISRSGHTNRGRVRQKSHKAAELVTVGSLR